MPKSFLYPGSLGEEPKSFLYPGSLGEDAPNLSRGSWECPTYQEVVGNVFLCDFVFSTFLDMCYNLHASHAAPCPGQQHIMQSCPTNVCVILYFSTSLTCATSHALDSNHAAMQSCSSFSFKLVCVCLCFCFCLSHSLTY